MYEFLRCILYRYFFAICNIFLHFYLRLSTCNLCLEQVRIGYDEHYNLSFSVIIIFIFEEEEKVEEADENKHSEEK